MYSVLLVLVTYVFKDVIAEYKLIEQHKSTSVGLFSDTSGVENEDDPTANTYNIIGNIDASNYINVDGKYHFKLIFGNCDGTTSTLIWKQSSWLTTSPITGYTPISIPTEDVWSDCDGCTFGGLGMTSRTETYLDGNANAHIYWWNAVGITKTHSYGGCDGIPGFNRQIAYSQSLYVENYATCDALEIDGFLDHCSANYASMLADIDTKAAQSDLDTAISDINAALDTKADQSTLDNEVANIYTALDTKADQSALDFEVGRIDGEIESINIDLDKKAYQSTLDNEIAIIDDQIAAINEHLGLLQGSGFPAQAISGDIIDDNLATWMNNNIFLLISLFVNIILVILSISIFCIAIKSQHYGSYNKVSISPDSDIQPFKL